MKKFLSILTLTALVVLMPHPAEAKAHPNKHSHSRVAQVADCPTTTTQTRNVSGMVAAPPTYGAPYTQNGHTYRKVTTHIWQGTQTRTATTDCDGVTTYSAWTGGTIVNTTTTQQLS